VTEKKPNGAGIGIELLPPFRELGFLCRSVLYS
jgi:hypothetical protein